MAKNLMWRPYILYSARPLLSSSLLQTHKRRLGLHHGNKTETSCLSFWSCSQNRKTTFLISDGYKVSKLGFGLIGGRRFTVRTTEVNDAGSIDSPLMQSMKKKIKEQLNAESVIVKDAYGDGRHVSIDVTSSIFEGESAVNRQRMVYKAIWEELQSIVHAVDQMTTKTPAEAAAQN